MRSASSMARRTLVLSMAVLGVSCADPDLTDLAEENLCPPSSGEFGSVGCATVQGRVLGAEDQPFSGILIIPVYPDDDDCRCNTPVRSTEPDGTFRMTILMFDGEPHPVSAFIRAARKPPSPSEEVVADSVAVELEFAPVGEKPPTTTVQITLPISSEESGS